MSRYVSIDHLGIVCLRQEFPDIYADFAQLAPAAIAPFYPFHDVPHVFLEIYSDVMQRCRSFAGHSLSYTNRVYVTTEYFHPVLILAGLPAHILSVIRSNLTAAAKHQPDPRTHGAQSIAAWVFEGASMEGPVYLTTTMLSHLLIAFHSDNLLAREHLRVNWTQ